MSDAHRRVRVDALLSAPGSILGALTEQARGLARLNRAVSAELDTELAPHCQVAGLHNGTLTIICNSAAWATRLRYHGPALRDRLAAAGVPISAIRVTVSPPHQPRAPLAPRARPPRPPLAADAAQSLRAAAGAVDDDGLSAALRRLAGRAD
jgi:hypothetical protein